MEELFYLVETDSGSHYLLSCRFNMLSSPDWRIYMHDSQERLVPLAVTELQGLRSEPVRDIRSIDEFRQRRILVRPGHFTKPVLTTTPVRASTPLGHLKLAA